MNASQFLSSFLREAWRYFFFLSYSFKRKIKKKTAEFCCIFLSVIQNIHMITCARERLSLDKPHSSNNNIERPNTKRTHFDWMRAHFSLDSRCMLFIFVLLLHNIKQSVCFEVNDRTLLYTYRWYVYVNYRFAAMMWHLYMVVRLLFACACENVEVSTERR